MLYVAAAVTVLVENSRCSWIVYGPACQTVVLATVASSLSFFTGQLLFLSSTQKKEQTNETQAQVNNQCNANNVRG